MIFIGNNSERGLFSLLSFRYLFIFNSFFGMEYFLKILFNYHFKYKSLKNNFI